MILKKKSAFTLIELLIVAAIIAILAASVFVILNTSRNKTKANSIRVTMRSIVPTGVQCRDISAIVQGGVSGTTNICSSTLVPNVLPSIPICGSNNTDTVFTKTLTTAGNEDTWRLVLSTCTNFVNCTGATNAYCNRDGCTFPNAGACK